jgi:phosphoribosylglycinamide formyltransferase-1
MAPGMSTPKKRVGILISGRGSNMMALIAAARAPDYPSSLPAKQSER